MSELCLHGLRSLVLVGDYGSGKSEVAVNLALKLADDARAAIDRVDSSQFTVDRQRKADGRQTSSSIAIADLDLVNPYFRCREAREPLEQAGVRVVVPGGYEFADLPILLPEIKGLLQDAQAVSVLDVGGDEVGARVLASLAPFAAVEHTAFWFVVNASRPFNDTVEGVQRAVARVEGAAGLRLTGLVANTHLMQETTPEMVVDGVRLAEQVAATRDVPVAFVAVMEGVAEQLRERGVELSQPLLVMRRLLVPPWVRRDATPRVGPAALRDMARGRAT